MATVPRHLCLSSAAAIYPETSSSVTRSSYSVSFLSLPLSSSPSYYSLSHKFHIRTRSPDPFSCAFSAAAAETLQLDSDKQQDAAEEPAGEEVSKTRLIAQNVPWTCTAEDVRSLFEKYGTVLDVELSMHNKTKNRGLAFVEMASPEEALNALRNLESSEFEGRTLRLNYAKPKEKKTYPPPKPRPDTTFNLFVGNLSYEARAKDLKEFFGSGSNSVVSAEVIFHENPRRSSGYGFVSFKSKKEAEAALKEFQAKIFMGRPIRVARSKQFVKVQKKEGLPSANIPTEEKVGADQANAEEPDTEQVGSSD